MKSPYAKVPVSGWREVTERLTKEHPLSTDAMVDAVLDAWKAIFDTSIGPNGFKIGVDIFPKPQVMGFLLHELIPLELQSRNPNKWRSDKNVNEKDLVYIPDDKFSIEIKASSNPSRIFGNRSYAQKGSEGRGKKAKSGYYLAVNFQRFQDASEQPEILRIRFGWLDHKDWIGQKAATGQQARLPPRVYQHKLPEIYSRNSED